MKKFEFYKYPRSILIPVGLFIIGMLLVFVVYKMHSINVDEPPNLNTTVQMPINTKANFIVETNVKFGEQDDPPLEANLSGNSEINIDLSDGKIVLEMLDLKAKIEKIPQYKLSKCQVQVKLNNEFPSTGQIDLDTGEMDISLDLLVDYSGKTVKNSNIHKSVNMPIPLSGTIDRKSGIIKLSGEATIPPAKDILPLPVTINVIATTDPVTRPAVSNEKED